MKSRLRHKREQYESLSVVVIKGIKHADALAIWVLLMAMPPNWEVRRCWLRKELGIGHIRLKKGIKRLMELKLWQTRYVRDQKGLMRGSEIWIFDVFEDMRPEVPNNTVPEPSVNSSISKKVTTHNLSNSMNNTTKPAEGGGTSCSLTFAFQFGVEWPCFLESYIDEHRAVAIAIKHGLSSEEVRKSIGELTAQSMKGFKKDAATAWVWLCKAQSLNQLNLSKVGEENLPPWS